MVCNRSKSKNASHYILSLNVGCHRCAIICAVLGVAGNTVTIFVLMSTRAMRQHSTTPFLMSMAASDLIFCGFNLPLMAVR